MDEPKKISLAQPRESEDHAARILREKLGAVLQPGQTPSPQPPPSAATLTLEEKVIAAIKTIYDPEIPLNIHDLGLIYNLRIDLTNAVHIQMTLTAPGCPVAGDIVAEVQRKVEAIPEVPRATVELVWDPPWTKDRLSEAARLELGLF